MLVVSDTSPITSLLSIGEAEILQDIYETVIIPGAVAAELRSYHGDVPSFIDIADVKDMSAVEKLSVQLDRGEAESIILAKEVHADYLLIDESLGRSVARSEGVPVVGLVGVLLIAKKRGLVASVGDVLNSLEQEAGFYLSDDVKSMAIEEAGE